MAVAFTCILSLNPSRMVAFQISSWFCTVLIQGTQNPEQYNVLEHVLRSVNGDHCGSSHG